jgi:tripartite-type tricarboxylate transporter receptor subunit TctC
MRSGWQKSLESGTVVVVLQTVPKAFADLAKVPLAIELAKSTEAKELIEYGIHFPSKITKTLALPPGTPAERAQILQKALQQAVNDPELIAEAEKARLGLNPVTADEMKKTFDGIFRLDPTLLAKLKTILF